MADVARCEFVDVAKLDNLHNNLTRYLAKCVIRRRVPETKENIEETKNLFVGSVLKLLEDPQRFLTKSYSTLEESMEAILSEASKQHAGILGKMSATLTSTETQEKDASELGVTIERASVWSHKDKEELARKMIHAVDKQKIIHCNKQFLTMSELLEHKAACGFRPAPCTNEGCVTMFSVRSQEAHDGKCEHKLLPCRQKCEELVKRKDMETHCTTTCAMKPVICPFADIGCAEKIVQGTFAYHLQSSVNDHLLLAVGAIHSQAALIEALKEALAEAQSRADRLQQQQTSITSMVETNVRQIGEAQTKIQTESEKKVKKASSSIESIGKDVGTLQQNVKSFQTQMDAIKVYLKQDAKRG